MNNQEKLDYARIEKAIHFIHNHFKQQPTLEEIAGAVHVSPFHFQKMFSKWAGVSPKKFMQYLSLDYAKTLLKRRKSVMETAYETGFSGASRLHDLFVSIEGMTPGEFKEGGAGLILHYCMGDSPFGKIALAATHKGVCHIFFEEEEEKAKKNLQARFPRSTLRLGANSFQKEALSFFAGKNKEFSKINLHLSGTPFQLKVWESLLRIPAGRVSTYGNLAKALGNPKASRAVGSAVAKNPVALLIPCHRVIQSSGKTGGYRWGVDKKKAILGWEAAREEVENG